MNDNAANGGMESIGRIIEKVFEGGKFGNSAHVAELWGCWSEIVGENIAEHCRPEKIHDGKLYVKVDSPIWHQQLDLLKEELKEKINQQKRDLPIEKIIFRLSVPS